MILFESQESCPILRRSFYDGAFFCILHKFLSFWLKRAINNIFCHIVAGKFLCFAVKCG